MQQGTLDWHNWRRLKVSSTDAPIIMKTQRFTHEGKKVTKKTDLDAEIEKRIEKKLTPVTELPETSFVQAKGHEYEDLALLDLERETRMMWRPRLFTSYQNDMWIASLDGYNEAMQRLIWECKYVGREKYEHAINDFMPLSYRVGEDYYPQIIHQALVTGVTAGYFTVCVDCQVFKSIPKGEVKFKHIPYTLQEIDIDFMQNSYRPKLEEFTEKLKSAIISTT